MVAAHQYLPTGTSFVAPKRNDMSELPANPSESTKRLNPHLYTTTYSTNSEGCVTDVKPGKRVRQSGKGMNKLETEFYQRLVSFHGAEKVRCHALTFKLANGVRYVPDFFVMQDDWDCLFEVKGPHAWDDAIVKLKVAAHEWSRFSWFLAWKEKGEWQEQRILP